MTLQLPEIDPSYRRICILSSSYSGSTLLSILLSQDSKYVGFGDTYLGPGISPDCTCKETVPNCSYRNAVATLLTENGLSQGIIHDPEYAIPCRSIAKRFGGTRLVKLYHLLGNLLGYERIYQSFLARERVYLRALLQPEQKKYYIDGSKNLVRAELLMRTDANTLLIHLIRDPLSVFDSAMNKHDRYGKGKQSINGHAKNWIFYNKRAQDLSMKYPQRSYKIVFDDMANKPEETIKNCTQSLKTEFDTSNLSDIDPTKAHVLGNRSRHSATSVKKAPSRPTKDKLQSLGLTADSIEEVCRVARSMGIQYETE